MRVARLANHVRALLVAAAAALLVSTTANTQSAFGVATLRDVMVPMRDGITLATDVYLPTTNGAVVSTKLPAILERTPVQQRRRGSRRAILCRVAMPCVIQDVRGRYKSGGHWRPITDDPTDGADTAKWIGAQSWSNASIGTIGTSYAGATQHALAIADAPFVKTMIPVDAMSNFGKYGVRHNGAFELRFFNWVLTMGNAAGNANAGLAAARAASDPAAAAALVDMGKCPSVRP